MSKVLVTKPILAGGPFNVFHHGIMRLSSYLSGRWGPYVGIGVQVVGLGLGFVTNFLLARLLMPEGYGVYGFAYSLVAFLGVPLQVGLATLLIKEVARYQAGQNYAHLRGLLRASSWIAIGLSVIAAIILFGFAATQRDRTFSVYAPVVAMASLLLPMMALSALRGGILRGLGQPIMGLLPDSIVRPMLLAAALLAVLFIPRLHVTEVSAMGLHAAAAGIAATIGVIMVRRYLPRTLSSFQPTYEWRRWLGALLPLSLLAGIQAVSSVVATLTLGSFHAPQELGFYRVAELGGSMVSMPLSAVAAYAAGSIAHLYATGSNEKLQQEATSMARIALAASIPIALILILAGPWLLSLTLDPAYEPAYVPMAILCIGQVLNTLAGIGGVVMTMSGHYREANNAFGVALVVQVAGALVLVPHYGAVGAAIVSTLATVTWSQMLRRQCAQKLKLSTFAFRRSTVV